LIGALSDDAVTFTCRFFEALFKDCLFQVGLKEREICRLKRRQQAILAARRGAIVHHTRSLPLEPVELMTAVMGGGAPGQRPTEIKSNSNGSRLSFRESLWNS
jgi:hypothetical protein